MIQKLHLHQWKLESNGPGLLKVNTVTLVH